MNSLLAVLLLLVSSVSCFAHGSMGNPISRVHEVFLENPMSPTSDAGKAAVARNPNNPVPYAALAAALINADRLEEAAVVCRAGLATAPPHEPRSFADPVLDRLARLADLLVFGPVEEGSLVIVGVEVFPVLLREEGFVRVERFDVQEPVVLTGVSVA